MKKYAVTISFNENSSNNRGEKLSRMIMNRLNRLLCGKHRHIQAVGCIEKTQQNNTHCHFQVSVPPKYANGFETVFEDVCRSFNRRYVGWFQPLLDEEGYGFYISKKMKHIDNTPLSY